MTSRHGDPLHAEIVEWDVKNWARALKHWERALPEPLTGQRALEIGARNGGLSLYLALRGCEVVCSDRDEPRNEARHKMERHGVGSRVRYEKIDVHAIPYADATFDIVAFKSVLGHVTLHQKDNGQKRAMDEMYRVLKPGGLLLFAENLAGSRIHRFLRHHCVGWGSSWRYVPLKAVPELTSAFRDVRYRTYGFVACFGRSERQRRCLALVDVLLDPLLRAQAKYILFGYARK
jgi:ubiquinone/menaquinone biosynthesis C-methylase UbiE